MKVNSIGSQKYNQQFGALHVSHETMEYLNKEVFRGSPELLDTFNKTIKAVERTQVNNPLCDIQLFKGTNVFTGDTCHTITISPKGCSPVVTSNTHERQYNFLSDADSTIELLVGANNFANNFADNFNKILMNMLCIIK